MADITDADYAHAKRVCEDFEIKNLGDCHNFYVQSNALFLANVFENFRNMIIKICKTCTQIYNQDPGLAWQALLKRTKGK